MDLENLKTWHWMLIGIIVGIAVGYVWHQNLDPAANTIRSLQQRQFEQLLLDTTQLDDGKIVPVLQNITVHPATGEHGQIVTAEMVTEERTRKDPKNFHSPIVIVTSLDRVFFPAPIPYAPQISVAKSTTVLEFLENLRQATLKADPKSALQYRYAWQEERNTVLAAGALGGFLLVGVVWPTLIRLIVGAGFGRPPREEKEESRATSSATSTPIAAKAGPTDAEKQELDDLNKSLEDKLAGFAATSAKDPDTEAEEAEVAKRVAELKTAPVEAAPKKTDEEELEWGGDFYPVVRGHHPKGHKEGDDKQKPH